MFTTPTKESVLIMGTEVTIEIDDDKLDRQGADGLYEHLVVTLRASYIDHKEFKRIYAHECIHALCDILGVQLDIHTEEILTHRISHMISYEL